MAGPELAISVFAPTNRSAISIATDIWDEVRAAAKLDPALPRVVDVIAPAHPPNVESAVLDSFVTAILEVVPSDLVGSVMRERAAYGGGVSEKDLLIRCLTVAAAALGELESIKHLRLDRQREDIQRPLISALQLAIARLGPFPAGRLASFKDAGREPVVEHVEASADDLTDMAGLAGQALAAASLAIDAFDIPALVRDLVRS